MTTAWFHCFSGIAGDMSGKLTNPSSLNQTKVQGTADLQTPESASGNHSTT